MVCATACRKASSALNRLRHGSLRSSGTQRQTRSRQRKLPVESVTRRAECSGSLRSRLLTAVCQWLPQGKQCFRTTNLNTASAKPWHAGW